MYAVMKNDQPWGYYDTQAEAICAIEEALKQEDGVVMRMVHEEDPGLFQGYVEVKDGMIEEAEPLERIIEREMEDGRDL